MKAPELRFDGSDNDYLLYGFHHELLADPEKTMSEGLAAFVPKYRRRRRAACAGASASERTAGPPQRNTSTGSKS